MRFFFFCVEPGTAENAGYEHGLVALAEGLSKLGYGIAGNRAYWGKGTEFLIPQTNEPPEAFEVIVVSHEWLVRYGTLPASFRTPSGPKRVYLDMSDGWKTEACTEPSWPADLILRAHYNQRFRYAKRVRPWAFGLTFRMIEATLGGQDSALRDPIVSCNFRVGHPVRDRLTTCFRKQHHDRFAWDESIDTSPPRDEEDYSLWVATGRRHNPAYFKRLKNARVSLAFGGFFAPGLPNAQVSLTGKVFYRGIQELRLATKTLTQFDSWRFWESLAAGCLTVHGPLDVWGARFPVQPVPGVHYWSFDGTRSVEGGTEGRTWAITNYGPVPTAKRLLEWLD